MKIEVEWIPRELNLRADLLRQIIDQDDWMINPAVFAELDKVWGPHTVDRFASFYNHYNGCENWQIYSHQDSTVAVGTQVQRQLIPSL